MMNVKMKLRILLTAIMLTCSISLAQAQGGPGGPGDPGDPGGDPGGGDTEVPVDGGLSLFIAAGVGYAVKRGYDRRKNHAVNITENKQL